MKDGCNNKCSGVGSIPLVLQLPNNQVVTMRD